MARPKLNIKSNNTRNHQEKIQAVQRKKTFPILVYDTRD